MKSSIILGIQLILLVELSLYIISRQEENKEYNMRKTKMEYIMKLFARYMIVVMSYIVVSWILVFFRETMPNNSMLSGFVHGIIIGIVTIIITAFIENSSSE
jgi:hypothetical protein